MAQSRGQLLANSQNETELLSPGTCKELTSPNRPKSQPERDCSQGGQPLRGATTEHRLHPPHGSHGMINVCYLRPLRFRCYCYATMKNEYCSHTEKMAHTSQNHEDAETRSTQGKDSQSREQRHQRAERKEATWEKPSSSWWKT